MLHRVLELGWSADMFGTFDDRVAAGILISTLEPMVDSPLPAVHGLNSNNARITRDSLLEGMPPPIPRPTQTQQLG